VDDTIWQPLAGKVCVILPDKMGSTLRQSKVEQLASSLLKLGCKVKVLELPNLPPNGDIVDWLDNLDAKEPADLNQAIRDYVDDCDWVRKIDEINLSSTVIYDAPTSEDQHKSERAESDAHTSVESYQSQADQNRNETVIPERWDSPKNKALRAKLERERPQRERKEKRDAILFWLGAGLFLVFLCYACDDGRRGSTQRSYDEDWPGQYDDVRGY
jgi:hypothetical protein